MDTSRQIGGLTCYAAFTKHRGRKYLAWYTPEIPVAQGPWKFFGTPGLILEVSDSEAKVQFLFNGFEIPSSVSEILKAPESPNWLSWQEYKLLLDRKMKEWAKSLQNNADEGASFDVDFKTIEFE